MIENIGFPINFPSFKYGVFERPAGKINLSLYFDPSRCTSKGRYTSGDVLAPMSSPLADKIAFYTIGRDLVLGLKQAEALPEQIKEIASRIYFDSQERAGDNHWKYHCHKDAVLVEPKATIPGNPRPGRKYIAARYFQNIKGFKSRFSGGSEWGIEADADTIEERLWLPDGESRFILPTIGQNTRFGLPQETTDTLDKAVKKWVNAGLSLTQDQAKDEVSKFFRGGHEEVCCVWSGYNYDSTGPLSVYMQQGPHTGIDGFWIRDYIPPHYPKGSGALGIGIGIEEFHKAQTLRRELESKRDMRKEI